jgi:hypothetical protein
MGIGRVSQNRAAAASLFLVALPCFGIAFWPLGGLTHSISCKADFGEPFTVFRERNAPLAVGSALVLDRDAPIPKVCEGYTLEMEIAAKDDATANVLLPVQNLSTKEVHVTAALRVGKQVTYLPMGRVRPGQTTSRTVPLTLKFGKNDVSAQLLVGP